jgi:predicted Zn-ribbon and HTH transcriptional regulator
MSDESPPSAGTVRARLRAALLAGPQTARDLSQRVGIPEHDVPDHLAHVERSLAPHGERLVIEAPTCFACGFVFTTRHRFTRPGHCPECRGRRISLPRFHIER